jgi:hypothetical protein
VTVCVLLMMLGEKVWSAPINDKYVVGACYAHGRVWVQCGGHGPVRSIPFDHSPLRDAALHPAPADEDEAEAEAEAEGSDRDERCDDDGFYAVKHSTPFAEAVVATHSDLPYPYPHVPFASPHSDSDSEPETGSGPQATTNAAASAGADSSRRKRKAPHTAFSPVNRQSSSSSAAAAAASGVEEVPALDFGYGGVGLLVAEQRYDHVSCVAVHCNQNETRRSYGSEGSDEVQGPTRLCVDTERGELWVALGLC